MDKSEFKEVFDSEISFGECLKYKSLNFFPRDPNLTDDERKKVAVKLYKNFIGKYYNSIGYVKKEQLVKAFDRCRENYNQFPTVKQLRDFLPKREANIVEVDYGYIEPTKEVQKKINDLMGKKYQVGEKQLRKNAAHCQMRWGGDWTEVIDRWLIEDAKLPKRG